jgi:uncharacterized phage-like protein YoqJ
MIERTCCFTGHRRIPSDKIGEIKTKLKHTLTEIIESGYLYFGVGGALGFDTLAALAILELKKDYPRIRLILVLPCVNQTKGWKEKDVDVYEFIKSQCDKYVYVSREYTSNCMLKRNRHLVDNSSLCICYLTENTGGTAYTVRYAKQKGLRIINIAER